MIKTIKKISTCLIVLLITISAQAQSSYWKSVSPNKTSSMDLVSRNAVPTDFSVFELNSNAFKSALKQAPSRTSVSESNTIIQLPSENGKLESFRVFETSTLSEGLRAKYPGIHSYTAKGIDDPTATAQISISPSTVHVMILSGNHPTIYVDPYTKNNTYFIQYSRNDLAPGQDPATCLVTEGVEAGLFDMEDINNNKNADDGTLRTYRLALACTGEYAQFHLTEQGIPASASDAVKKAAIISEFNTAMTRVNGLFERDVALTMVIIANTEDLIYFDAGTDPYTNSSGSAMLGQNQTNIDAVIGTTNYDIGHVFSTGGGGVARLNSPCNPTSKAMGVTGLPSPIDDQFYVEFVAHEMGHQYGANHTFNGTEGNCSGNQRTAATAYETGSGTTIMSYAGICGSQNVQSSSDDYFHFISLIQMFNNVSAGVGSNCGTQSPTNNLPPVVEQTANFIVPGLTPFVLTGAATDPDTGAAALTYLWDQRDNALGDAPPQEDSDQGPIFRSRPATGSPSRIFPRLPLIKNGLFGERWERLVSVDRVIRFRLVVRDNEVNGGASAGINNNVTVVGDAGPFMVTAANTSGTAWTTRDIEEITWDVANTDLAPLNTATVDILFSSDGGDNFDIVLLSGTPNDGSANVSVPIVNTTQGRVMVKASDNIYFDMNDRNIRVEGSLGIDDNQLSDLALYPNPNNGQFSISFTATTGDDVAIAMYDIRGRLINTQSFSNPASNFSETLDYRNLTSGIYFVTITNGNQKTTKKLTIK